MPSYPHDPNVLMLRIFGRMNVAVLPDQRVDLRLRNTVLFTETGKQSGPVSHESLTCVHGVGKLRE